MQTTQPHLAQSSFQIQLSAVLMQISKWEFHFPVSYQLSQNREMKKCIQILHNQQMSKFDAGLAIFEPSDHRQVRELCFLTNSTRYPGQLSRKIRPEPSSADAASSGNVVSSLPFQSLSYKAYQVPPTLHPKHTAFFCEL